MKIVLQRVSEAKVVIQNEVAGSIGKGILALLGVHQEDTPEMTEWFVKKLLNLRIFEDNQGKMNKSVTDIGGEVLVVSQFTLYANCHGGRRPDFIQAAGPETAEPIYDKFVAEIRRELGRVQTGRFGAEMKVSLVNEGPVTIILEEKVK